MTSDPARAVEWEQRIQAFIQRRVVPYITEQNYSNTAVDKLLAAVGDWAPIGTRIRWPYRSIPEAEVEPLRLIARTELPELFALGEIADTAASRSRGSNTE